MTSERSVARASEDLVMAELESLHFSVGILGISGGRSKLHPPYCTGGAAAHHRCPAGILWCASQPVPVPVVLQCVSDRVSHVVWVWTGLPARWGGGGGGYRAEVLFGPWPSSLHPGLPHAGYSICPPERGGPVNHLPVYQPGLWAPDCRPLLPGVRPVCHGRLLSAGHPGGGVFWLWPPALLYHPGKGGGSWDGLRRRAECHGSGVRAPEDCNDVGPVGLVMNLLSASVLACPLLAVVPQLAPGHVPWLWTAAVFQLVVCVLSYRSMDSLTATFYGFTSILHFAEGYIALLTAFSIHPSSPIPFPVVFAVLFFILALFSCQKSLAEGLYQLFYVAYTIALAAQPSRSFQSGAQGVQAAIFIVSTVMLLVTSYNNVSANRIPTGEGVFKALVTRVSGLTLRPHDRHSHAPYLGYSRYADAEVLGHACSVLAVFSITASTGDRAPLGVLVLPWAVVAGGVLQLLVGSVAFSRGKTLESMAFILYGVMWSIWGLTRYGRLYGDTQGFNLAVGIISFLLFNSLVTVGALFLNVAWVVYAATFHLIIISFLLDAMGALPYGYDIGVSIVFGLMSFYCFLSGLFSLTFLTPQLPLGRALVRLSGMGEGGRDICLHVPARKATAVHQIAEIMKSGGICGMPTDTVYVLVAACNRPDAVEKAYKCKQQAQDRPMSLWVSSINQLEPVRSLLSALLWDFMSAAWPSSISMVIARGPWMEMFGLGESAKHIGTPQSIAIRNPNCAVATHLINLVGPIAVTSANPTGEADTTHHNQVYAKLGDKVDGVLCDGPSPENIASTVVDCTKIDSGHIGFFRVGLIPKSQVLQIFEEVQKRHSHGQINPVFEADLTEPDPNPNLTDPQRNTDEDNTESTESSTVPPPTQSPAYIDTSTLATQPRDCPSYS
ncbi:uncharacterized protein LOC121557720 [Coregonus clupeaformis]|uniref:uncharacterized protein LOC121557720 n=1 Tax=Coregonus clupeaformis TaxID=59861 RepID=UPI001E1C3383|nr:uncharacterized protein LOC121557720 [Coregonus clupeaformis]